MVLERNEKDAMLAQVFYDFILLRCFLLFEDVFVVQAKKEHEKQRELLVKAEEESSKRRNQMDVEKQERITQMEAWENERLDLAAQLLKEKEVYKFITISCYFAKITTMILIVGSARRERRKKCTPV